jgi:hypothetical protein
MKQQVEFFTDQQREASIEAALSRGTKSDRESQLDDSGDSETTSDNSGRLKVAAAMAALAGISCDFGPSNIPKTNIGSTESYARYFPMGYGQPPSAESMSKTRVNEAIIFKDFFTAGLRMPLHPILVDILHKFWVQLHHLMPNAINHISKFI